MAPAYELMKSLMAMPAPDAAPARIATHSRQVEYSDAKVSGLRLSVGAGGKRSWIFRYSLPGRRYAAK